MPSPKNDKTKQSSSRQVDDNIRHIVIIGALSAIAMATARIYAAEGARFILMARNGNRLEALSNDLLVRGAKSCKIFTLDFEKEMSKAHEHMKVVQRDLGRVDDVLVFFGYLGDQKLAEESGKESSKIISANFSSASEWCLAASDIIENQNSGNLIVISSVAGDRGRQSNYIYGAAKGGLSILIQGIAHRLAKTKARAIVLKLGFVDTPMTDAFDKKGPLWVKPEVVAKKIYKAAEKGGAIQYVPGIWKYIMLIIRFVPSFIFHKTKL